ncbi:hypothetical protein QN277_013935 [Acacia crassicarpa]|uniref:Pectinesterase inhibitor domain-containing protein n=1 Tax=Acacia crassicarpa TaxID=499986 RepID=A0AAE1TGA8_9FABA|nr:hypothetical protein QN277_013935 [Acacia crassicarpa]
MELNKKIILLVPLICCSLLSGISAVPSHRFKLFEEPPSPAPTPSPYDEKVVDLEASAVTTITAASQHSAQLVDLCKDAEAPHLCVETIAPFIHGALDPVVAVNAEFGATMNLTVKVSDTIKTLQAQPDISNDDKASLEICADQYSSIVDTINDCLDSIKQNDVYGAWMKFSAVLSFQQACEDAFREGGSPIPFKEDSKTLFQLGGNCLAILMHLSGETSVY